MHIRIKMHSSIIIRAIKNRILYTFYVITLTSHTCVVLLDILSSYNRIRSLSLTWADQDNVNFKL